MKRTMTMTEAKDMAKRDLKHGMAFWGKGEIYEPPAEEVEGLVQKWIAQGIVVIKEKQ